MFEERLVDFQESTARRLERLRQFGVVCGLSVARFQAGGSTLLAQANEHARFAAFSVNKLPVANVLLAPLMEASLDDEGDLLRGYMSQRLPIEKTQYGGAGRSDEEGSDEASRSELVRDMLKRSGNAAAKTLILDAGVDEVNARFQAIGMEDTAVVAGEGGALNFGSTTPHDAMCSLEHIAQNPALFTKLYPLLACRSDQSGGRLYANGMEDVVVATKEGKYRGEGSDDPPARHEAGFVRHPESGELVLVAALTVSRSQFGYAMSNHELGGLLADCAELAGGRPVKRFGKQVMAAVASEMGGTLRAAAKKAKPRRRQG